MLLFPGWIDCIVLIVTFLVVFYLAFEFKKLLLFVAEPEMVKKVLVNDFTSLPNRRTMTFHNPLFDNMIIFACDEQWRKIRRTASPAFSSGKLRRMNSLIEDCALITTEHLKKAASNEADIDVQQLFGHYTLDVIARCAFGTRLDSHADQTNEFVTKSTHAFSGRLTPRLFVFLEFPLRRKGAKNSTLQLEDLSVLQADVSERHEVPTGQSIQLTEDESMAQCVLFFIAGQNTTSTAISHTMYLLALHPDVQKNLRDEVDECFRVHGDYPSLDVIAKLKYMHCVVSESLRMYPPVMRIERSPCRDYILSDTGDTEVKVMKGHLVAIPVYSMHHDPEYFPEPSKFDPDRFSDENLENIRPFTYLPFGEGPRNCIGARLALQAVKLSLLHTIRNVELVRTERTKVPLEFEEGFNVVLTAKDITVGIRKRS
ncbi:hypothetical protein MTO96_025792 [Rhipicephalus appendiculatus]